MKCIFCKEDIEDYIDITQEIKIIPTIISTDEKLGYCRIIYKGNTIGSLGMNGIKLNTNQTIILPNEQLASMEDFKIISNEHDGEPFYFRIFIKKEYYKKIKKTK